MEAPATKQATAEVPRSLSAGVTEDFEAFSEKFIAAQSVRYEHFLEIWKEMQMSLIFAGRQSDQECREFTEECLQLALTYSSSSHPFQVRVWALYMLYAIYFKHPFYLRVKIRITLPEWRELLSLITEIHQQQHLDAEYVFTRLRYDHAFHFVATKNEMYPGVRSQMNEADSQQQKLDLLMEEKSIVSQLFEPDTIDQLSAIHEEYHRVKCGLEGHSSSIQQSLNIIENGLVQIVTKAIAGHEAWRKTKVGRKLTSRRRREDGTGGQSTSESEADSDFEQDLPHSRASVGRTISSIRAEIKNRAFSGNTSSRRYRRRAAVDTAVNSDLTRQSTSSPAGGDVVTSSDHLGYDVPLDSAGIASMPLISNTTRGKVRKVKGSKVKAAGTNAEDGRGKRKKKVRRRQSPELSAMNKDNKRKKSATDKAHVKDRGDKEEEGKDGVQRKKVRKKRTASSAAVTEDQAADEGGLETVKRKKIGRKKSSVKSAAAEPMPPSVSPSSSSVTATDKKLNSVGRTKKAKMKTTKSSS